jgi:hypothetical protein
VRRCLLIPLRGPSPSVISRFGLRCDIGFCFLCRVICREARQSITDDLLDDPRSCTSLVAYRPREVCLLLLRECKHATEVNPGRLVVGIALDKIPRMLAGLQKGPRTLQSTVVVVVAFSPSSVVVFARGRNISPILGASFILGARVPC